MLYKSGQLKSLKEVEDFKIKNSRKVSSPEFFGCTSTLPCERCFALITDSICLCLGRFVCPECKHQNGKPFAPFEEKSINKEKIAKTELEKQLHEAELTKIRAIDKVKEIKAEIEKVSKEPPIFDLMPIGSVWCGHEVINHDRDSGRNPIKLLSRFGSWTSWPTLESLHELMDEQRKLNAIKRAADALVKHLKSRFGITPWLINECKDYENIIKQEQNETKANTIGN